MKTTALDHSLVTTEVAPKSGLVAAVSNLVASLRKAASDRALARQLADMDDALLRDIGLSDDEIYRVRRGKSVSPDRWAA